MWDEITYLFPNFIDTAIEIWEWISNSSHNFTGCVITCWWKLIHVSKRGPREWNDFQIVTKILLVEKGTVHDEIAVCTILLIDIFNIFLHQMSLSLISYTFYELLCICKILTDKSMAWYKNGISSALATKILQSSPSH